MKEATTGAPAKQPPEPDCTDCDANPAEKPQPQKQAQSKVEPVELTPAEPAPAQAMVPKLSSRGLKLPPSSHPTSVDI